MSDWVKHKFDWLAAVLADRSTRGLPHDIATLMAIRYFHSKRQQAWPSIATLARDLNVSRRGIQIALDKLVAAGLLERARGGGRGNSSRYYLPEKISLPRRDFIPLDVVEACTDFGIYQRLPESNFSYVAFCDAAGGTGGDSFSVAVAHRLRDQADTVVIDALRERRPRFVPRDVIAEFAQLLKSYNVSEVQSDKFAGGFHADEWQRNGICFKPCDNTTSENYLRALPMLLSGRVRLIDNATLRAQLASLERRVSPAGHETVSHPQVASAHDDCATAVCGALSISGKSQYTLDPFQPDFVDRDAPPTQLAKPPVPAANQRAFDYVAAICAANGVFVK